MFIDADKRTEKIERFRTSAISSGRPFWAEKTPRHIHYLSEARREFPNAWFILMVRDGRDVVASLKTRLGSAEKGVARWVRDNTKVIAHLDDEDTILLRYEDLIENPRTELQRVCKGVGLPFSDDMLRYHEVEREWFGSKKMKPTSGIDGQEHRENRSWQVNQPIFDARGKWRKVLNQEDLQLLEKTVFKSTMMRLGY